VYVYENRVKYLSSLKESSRYPQAGTVRQLDGDRKRLKEIKARRAADGEKEVLNTTDMIEKASKAAFSRDSLTREVLLAWNAGSGAAHGQMWHLYGTRAMQAAGVADDDGLAVFKVGGTLSVISNPFCAAFELAKRGWDLVDRRGKTIRFNVGARSYRR
jgi:hypothetical protein